jgi:hypothetical protein
LKDLADIFLQPAPVLSRQFTGPRSLLPIMLLCAMSGIGTFLYFSQVDTGWFLEYTLLQSNPDMPDAQLKAITEASSSGSFLRWSATFGSVLGLLVVLVAFGGYFWLAGKLTGAMLSFKQGLALASWSSMPMAINSLLIIIGTFTMTSQTPLETLSITTLDPLLLTLDFDSPWKTLATSFTFLVFWTTYLGALGWKLWTGAESWTTPLVVAAAPAVGVFAFMALRALLA